ncbi:MAG: tRNA (mnm(5)s(2)U34)-methyltransferase [Bacillota bacterium]
MTTLQRPASAVLWARVFIRPALGPGATAVDATSGNGLDTVFLAENVGPGGMVYAMDIQEIALKKTRENVEAAGLSDRVAILQSGHQHIKDIVPGPVSAVMFNLGYLPGSDRSVTTRPETTIEGIRGALRLLGPGGRLSVIVYTGHPGSGAESGAVGELLQGIEEKEFSVQKMTFWNSRKNSPELYFVARTGDIK